MHERTTRTRTQHPPQLHGTLRSHHHPFPAISSSTCTYKCRLRRRPLSSRSANGDAAAANACNAADAADAAGGRAVMLLALHTTLTIAQPQFSHHHHHHPRRRRRQYLGSGGGAVPKSDDDDGGGGGQSGDAQREPRRFGIRVVRSHPSTRTRPCTCNSSHMYCMQLSS